jgi:conjugal transfer/entry exclusion protein
MAMDIVSILDRMEALISTSLKVPATQRTFLDTRKLQELVDQLRMAVPQDVKAAKQILAKKDDIVTHAELERRKLRSRAEEEYRNRLNQTEVMKDAQRKAAETIEEAEQKSQRMLKLADTEVKSRKAEVDAYSVKTLRNLERQLTANLTSIRNGLALLNGIDTFEVVASGNGTASKVEAGR